MKELLQYLQDAFQQAGNSEIARYLAIIIGLSGVMSLLWKLGTKLYKHYQQRILGKQRVCELGVLSFP